MNGISVITICFNNLADLQATCASIDLQTTKPAEHWVINGSNTPDINDWLTQSPQPVYRKWISERDKGIADAFNKGINKATHEITHLLHAGDCYVGNDVLESVHLFFKENDGTQWVSGNMQLIRGGLPVIVGKPFEKKKLYRGMRSVSHPTWFVKKEVYGRIGLFNEDYKIAMDYDMMCRIADEPYRYLNKTIAVFDDTGVSTVNYLLSLKETRMVYESHFGFSPWLVLWQLRLKLLYHLLNTGLGKWLFSLKKRMGLENV